MDTAIALGLLVAGYVLCGIILASACWLDDPNHSSWRASDWIAAVFCSPVVVVEVCIEQIRQR